MVLAIALNMGDNDGLQCVICIACMHAQPLTLDVHTHFMMVALMTFQTPEHVCTVLLSYLLSYL